MDGVLCIDPTEKENDDGERYKHFLNNAAPLHIPKYTIGHIVIAMACNYFITGTSLNMAAMDAIIEPIVNGFWFYILHKAYQIKTTQQIQQPREKKYGFI